MLWQVYAYGQPRQSLCYSHMQNMGVDEGADQNRHLALKNTPAWAFINPKSATYNIYLQQMTIQNFAAFSKITNKA